MEDPETKLIKDTTYKILKDNQKKQLGKNNEAKMTLYNALPRKEYKRVIMCKTSREKFPISNEETIDSGFIRFNAIMTSIKSLDPDYSSKNHVRKFLRALPLKWRAKVTAIEEAKDLATLPLDELIRDLKVYEMVLDNDGIESKITKEMTKEVKLNVNAKSVYNCGNKNHLADNCPKSNKKALIGVTWSDSEDGDETRNDATCLMAIDSQEVQPNPSTSNNDLNIINFEKENQELLKFSKDFSKAYEKLLQEKRALEKEHSKLFSKVNELELEVKKLARNKEIMVAQIITMYIEDHSIHIPLTKIRYSQTSKAYIVLNKETLKIEESLNVTFDESLPKSRTSPLVDDDMIEEQAIQNHDKTQNPNCDLEEVIPRVENIREVRDHPIDQVIR
ncbi:hypothetical protein Tco_1185198 [Tanacetum coccineum]